MWNWEKYSRVYKGYTEYLQLKGSLQHVGKQRFVENHNFVIPMLAVRRSMWKIIAN